MTRWECCTNDLVVGVQVVPGRARGRPALENVNQKIGSASDVGLQGFSGLALTGGPWTLALLVNDTVSRSSSALPKISSPAYISTTSSTPAHAVKSADQCVLGIRTWPRSCKSILFCLSTYVYMMRPD